MEEPDSRPLWQVYLLQSADCGSSYVGIALNPKERLLQHNGERPGGARRTRAGRPWKLVACSVPLQNRAEATRSEQWVKRGRGLEARRALLRKLTADEESGRVGKIDDF